ncbi:Dbl-domain containing protein [Moelleriella libera RCEF 2490]|uniref:Dbl-domain containing protein n=1 Tax=Moelleriella libera RCEF 2490 TaxID=1081109 RepID=A0A168C1E3_9HYPO|nr:Dbl-domain containing protein [Moelleriella libera RCEF 2490]
MDPGPDAGQLRHDAVDSRPGTLNRQMLYTNLDHLSQIHRIVRLDAGQDSPQVPASSTLIVPAASLANHTLYDNDQDDQDERASPEAVRQASLPVSYSTATKHHLATTEDQHAPPLPIDPDDFYKNYQGPNGSSGPDVLPMAATSSPRPALRSNGDGSSPRHAAVPASRSVPRANLRSVSSPLDSRPLATSTSARMPSGKPSVKDLKRHFDQNATTKASPPPSRIVSGSRLVKSRAGASDLDSPQSASTPAGRSVENGTARGDVVMLSSLARGQSRVAANDKSSNNAQSFASRIGKPRHQVDAKQAHRHVAKGSPRDSPAQNCRQSPSPTARDSQFQGLLFGEVASSDRHDVSVLGHGIEGAYQRRTSDSTVLLSTTGQDTAGSMGTESPSPPLFYRGPASHPNAGPSVSTAEPYPRPRARSEDNGSSPSTRGARNRAAAASPQPSRLPVSSRKPTTPGGSTSPSPTRSNSPVTLRRQQPNRRQSRTSPGVARAETPTQKRLPLASGSNSSRLQAYIASPPAKSSPTLRSSRPRQPIASTSGHNMNESGKSRPDRAVDSTARRRKISIGPIDFEQRREHIRLAYTKTIRESEALEARHRAANARRKSHEEEIADSASARAATSTTTRSTAAVANARTTEGDVQTPATGSSAGSGTSQRLSSYDAAGLPQPISQRLDSSREPVKPLATTPLKIDVPSAAQSQTVVDNQDSPTLGLPGSFPDQSPVVLGDEPPMSAVSSASNVTEFDTEPQTDPPVKRPAPTDVPSAIVKLPSPERHPSHTDAEPQFCDEQAPVRPTETPPAKFDERTFARNHDGPLVMPDTYVNGTEQPDFDCLGIGSFQSPDSNTTLVPSARDVAASPIMDHTIVIPFPRMDSLYGDSDCQSEGQPLILETSEGPQDDDAVTDTCTEETDDGEGREMLHRDSDQDRPRSYRTSTCASSEADASDHLHYSNPGRHEQTDGPSPIKLSVPDVAYEDERFSRQSTWTDMSVGSPGQSGDSKSPAPQPHHESPKFGHVTIFSTQAGSSVKDAHHRRRQAHESESLRPSSGNFKSLHLPELDTGDGFSVPYPTAENEPEMEPRSRRRYIPSPSHEPPPVPPSATGSDLNSRTSSAYYDQSQYGSTLLNSRHGSNESMFRAATSQSADSGSLAATEQHVSTQTSNESHAKPAPVDQEELSDQERHRLVQRRNVLKELVDTEAVFVRDMNIVEEIYKGTAEACPRLDNKTIKLVFRNSDQIISFHTSFLSELKEAVGEVYVPKGAKSQKEEDPTLPSSTSPAAPSRPSDVRDRRTSIGPVFERNLERMKLTHEGFLRASDHAAKRLIQIQRDPTVQVWLTECNEVAKDLTAAWDLDSLLIKPMQRITKYPNLIGTLLQHTPVDHPDRASLMQAKDTLETAIIDINKSKKNFELVGQIVAGRKSKESDVKAGLARVLGMRGDKLQGNRQAEEPDFKKLIEKFGDDYLRLQVVLRDVEFYTRQVSAYVHEFLQYMSSIELVMRLQPGNYPELESKWIQFNISVRDLERVALEDHLSLIRKHVIEPFEHVIKAYGNPSLALKKRDKRRLDYERFEQLRRGGKSPDPRLKELVEQYEALNETLRKELPQLSAFTGKIGHICAGSFVNIQAKWFATWRDKMKAVLTNCPDMPSLQEVVATFQRDYPFADDQLASIGILREAADRRASESTSTSADDSSLRTRMRPLDVGSRSRGQSVNGDAAPILPAPDFGGRQSGSFTLSPSHSAPGFANGHVPSPHQYFYRDYYAGITSHHGIGSTPRSPDFAGSARSGPGAGLASTRPSTGRSHESGMLGQNADVGGQNRRSSSATYGSNHAPQDSQREQRFSNMFHSALPMSDGPDEGGSRRNSRASSRERRQSSDGYNVLWLAASLFEFNIVTTKHEAGYPYLTYHAGEIFDVIAEKGELWLAKNQDDPTEQVGWIWSKHFAKLADS